MILRLRWRLGHWDTVKPKETTSDGQTMQAGDMDDGGMTLAFEAIGYRIYWCNPVHSSADPVRQRK